MYHSSLSVLVTNNMSSGAKMHHESTETESHQMAKMFFFPLLGFLLVLQMG